MKKEKKINSDQCKLLVSMLEFCFSAFFLHSQNMIKIDTFCFIATHNSLPRSNKALENKYLSTN